MGRRSQTGKKEEAARPKSQTRHGVPVRICRRSSEIHGGRREANALDRFTHLVSGMLNGDGAAVHINMCNFKARAAISD